MLESRVDLIIGMLTSVCVDSWRGCPFMDSEHIAQKDIPRKCPFHKKCEDITLQDWKDWVGGANENYN